MVENDDNSKIVAWKIEITNILKIFQIISRALNIYKRFQYIFF